MAEIQTLRWLLRRGRRQVPLLILLLLVSAGSSILSVFFALGTKNVINGAISGDKAQFVHACMVQLGLVVSIIACMAGKRYLEPKLIDQLDREWKQSFLHQLLQGEYAAVSRYHSGELINRLNNDMRTLTDGLVTAIPNLVAMLTKLLAASVTLFAMDKRFTLILIGIGLAAFLLTGAVRKILKQLHRKASESEGRVLSFLQESLEKLMVIQAMDLSEQVEKRADVLLEERHRVRRKRRRVSLVSHVGVSMLFYLCGFVTLAWCGYGLFLGTMTYGAMSAIIQLVNQVQAPFANLSGFLPKFTAMIVAADRMRELEKLPGQEAAAIEDVPARYEDMTAFEARNLTFAYDEETILEDVSFTLPKGAFAAITGPSGIGKSTLLKLMLGVYVPQSGALYVNGKSGSERLGRGTRRLFAYVPQGNFLFSGTIRENLLMIRENATEEELNEAIYVSAMDKFLDQLPDGLNTVIGEHGEGLSEGQAQRVSIARAILSGAPVLLLDEATSALDGETETQVLQRICRMQRRTCIAVTHRPAALEQADYQLCVDNKNIKVVALNV